MIRPKCDKCGTELDKFGGLAFAPPETLPDGSAGEPATDPWKVHLCFECWLKFMYWLKAPNKKLTESSPT